MPPTSKSLCRHFKQMNPIPYCCMQRLVRRCARHRGSFFGGRARRFCGRRQEKRHSPGLAHTSSHEEKLINLSSSLICITIMVISTRIEDDELEASIWNLERAPSPQVDDPIGQIRGLGGSYSSPPTSVVGSPTTSHASARRFPLAAHRQVRSESNLSPILDRLRMVAGGSAIGASQSSSPTTTMQHHQQSQPQLTHRGSLSSAPPSTSSPKSPPQSTTIWSQFFHGKHQEEPRRATISVGDATIRQGSSLSLESISMERDDSLATPKSQHQARQLPSTISERGNHWNVTSDDDDDDDDDDDTYDADFSRQPSTSLNDIVTPVIFLGFTLPLWCSKKPSWTQVSELVVRYAPCFMCCRSRFHGTDRAIVGRMNILNAIFAVGQVGMAIFFGLVETAKFVVRDREPEYSRRATLNTFVPNLWNPSSSLTSVGLFGFIILVTNLVALRAIQEVNLLGAIRYLWVITWTVPFEIYFSISLFGRKQWNAPIQN